MFCSTQWLPACSLDGGAQQVEAPILLDSRRCARDGMCDRRARVHAGKYREEECGTLMGARGLVREVYRTSDAEPSAGVMLAMMHLHEQGGTRAPSAPPRRQRLETSLEMSRAWGPSNDCVLDGAS